MAFRRVTPERADHLAALAAQQAGNDGSWHAAAAADLLTLAEAPADANTALSAIATWRADQKARRARWARLALLQIGSGDNPDEVCAELGIGRTALQQAVRAEGSQLSGFTEFLYMARPEKRKESD